MDIGLGLAIGVSAFAVAGGMVGVVRIVYGNRMRNGNSGRPQGTVCPLHGDLAEDVKEIKKDTGELKTGVGRLEGQIGVLIAKVCSK